MKQFNTIGERYKYLREELTENDKNGKWMTTRELSVALTGYEHYASDICRIENSNREPKIKDLKLYHDYFKVPYEFLLGETNSLEHKNMTIGKELGLSDTVINTLKGFKYEYKTDIVQILNYIFEIGSGYQLLSDLNNYFFAECDKFVIKEKKIEKKIIKDASGNETSINLDKSKSCTNTSLLAISKDKKTETIIENKDVEFIFQQKLYKSLSNMKNSFKEDNEKCKLNNQDCKFTSCV